MLALAPFSSAPFYWLALWPEEASFAPTPAPRFSESPDAVADSGAGRLLSREGEKQAFILIHVNPYLSVLNS